MADKAYIRFVDDQRVQVRSLLAAWTQAITAVQKRAFFCAAVRAAEQALIGYFAELTEKRFQSVIWQQLKQGQGSFVRLQNKAACEITPIVAFWLEWESRDSSSLGAILAAIKQVNSPLEEVYRTGLLAQTTLEEALAVDDNLIATSAVAKPPEPVKVSGESFLKAWQAVEAQILNDREQALEC